LYESHLIDNDNAIVSLAGADLCKANLSRAALNEAALGGADLSWAHLTDATRVTTEHLEENALSLEAATMPDGSRHV